jgi:multisubunit Na+/H+ antiporter MnhF subunit
MKFIEFSEAVKDSEGQTSSKRLITFSAFFITCITYFVDMFTSFTVSEFLFDGMIWIVVAGLGFISSERFSKFKK